MKNEPGKVKTDSIIRTEDELFINGEKVQFHYNREERIRKNNPSKKTKDERKCFFCGKNLGVKLTFLNILMVVVIGLFFSNVVGKMNVEKQSGLQYLISKKNFTSTPQFNLQIKNTTKKDQILNTDHLLFEIYDEQFRSVFSHKIIPTKKEFRPDEFYLESIVTDTLPKGKYKAVVYIDPSALKKIQLEFKVQ